MLLPGGRVLTLALILSLTSFQGPWSTSAPAMAQTVASASSEGAEAGDILPRSGSSDVQNAQDAEDVAANWERDVLSESFVVPPLPELAQRPHAIVTQVPDGDTLRLADRRTIRLACIDAPDLSLSRPSIFSNEELREENFRIEGTENAAKENGGKASRKVPDQYFAREARDALKELALKKQVTLRADKVKKDPQGRLVADACLEDGTSLSALLVANGHAYVVQDPDYPEDYYTALAQLQAEAMAERRGFWALLLDTGAGNHTFVGNTETLLFYSSEDVRSQQIKPRQRMYFGTLLDAFSSGYAPANSREIWPIEKNDCRSGIR